MNMRSMVIGVVGGGIVGHALCRSYLEHVREVRVWDTVPTRRTHSYPETLDSDIIFVSLPTPQKDGMGLDTAALDSFFSGTRSNWHEKCFVIRSTVPIGTTRRLREQYNLTNLVHSPEFLTARCAVTDAQLPARNIIGVPDWKEPGCCNLLANLYADRFPHAQLLTMTSDESEAVKLMQNGYFAAQVSLWNELRSLADKLGLDWEVIHSALLADGRIHPSHSQVPGHTGYGFSGSCLPKDACELVKVFLDTGLRPHILEAVLERNKTDILRRVGDQ